MTKTVRNSQRTNKTTIERKIEYSAVSATGPRPCEILYGAQKALTSPIGLRRARLQNRQMGILVASGNCPRVWVTPGILRVTERRKPPMCTGLEGYGFI